MTQDRGKLVVISGPSGAGKTTVCRALRENPRVEFSVSATTRTQRPGEVDRVDYHFMSQEEFLRRRDDGEFLESASYNGSYYGTLRQPMEAALAAGKVFILEIEVQGTRHLRENGVVGDYIFIVPPGLEVLRERLTRRGSNSAEEIEQRMEIAAKEMEAAVLYDFVVENRLVVDAIAEVASKIGL